MAKTSSRSMTPNRMTLLFILVLGVIAAVLLFRGKPVGDWPQQDGPLIAE